eukprot:COSAG02_NODE_9942_length_2069_cov_1.879695_2_plen_95_part_00
MFCSRMAHTEPYYRNAQVAMQLSVVRSCMLLGHVARVQHAASGLPQLVRTRMAQQRRTQVNYSRTEPQASTPVVAGSVPWVVQAGREQGQCSAP